MNRQPHSLCREAVVANAIQSVVSELRLVDVADYIAFVRLESFACVADIVDSAAELYFMPGTLRLGHSGEAHVGWTENPRIVLDLELHPRGATVYFQLTLSALHASVVVNYVAFADASSNPEENTEFLARALDEARIRKTAALRMTG
ncbi:hypothetical protein GA830_00425 [Mesorhizobium sp. NBSH29]|uniref:hypothetical protein n=1 Tax=Mesorhizobium sp. NBSH29 TaxID=2654249 RepID=UPI0018967508|nr:hypothetical protein [Mesorhizobium sp. NBSH29]QPC85375.1 hypothetical protein GA830_00425 [Mesorhizobium sp. NBSH29]